MIENLFINILNMSLTASLVIMAVLLVRLVLRKVPKIFSYALWFIVLFRLLCPVSFSSAFSLVGVLQSGLEEQGFVQSVGEEVGNTLQNNIGNLGVGNDVSSSNNFSEDIISDVDNSTGLSQSGDDVTSSFVAGSNGSVNVENDKNNTVVANTTILESVFSIGAIIWLAGIIVLIAYSLITLISLRRKIRSAENEKGNIYITEGIDTPFVYGIIRPRIYLPSSLGDKEREYILVHEQIHIKRCDHIVKLVAFGALCLHWFNPLVWFAFLLMGKDMEMSCDETVIRKIGSDVKKDYSSSLLALASGRKIIGGTPLAFGEGDTGSRIKNVLSYKKPAIWMICIAVIICVVLGVFLTANPSGNDNEKANGESESYIDESETDEVSTEEGETESEETTESETATESAFVEVVDIQYESADYRGTINPDIDMSYLDTVYNYEDCKEDLYVYSGKVKDGQYFQTISNINIEGKTVCIERAINGFGHERANDVELPIADDCIFRVNHHIDKVEYEDIEYEEFVRIVEAGQSTGFVIFKDGKITEIALINNYQVYWGGGTDTYYKDYFIENPEILQNEYTLVRAEIRDIADCEGDEYIEIYGENNQESVVIVIRDPSKNILYVSRDKGWFDSQGGFYAGDINGVSYLFGIGFSDLGEFDELRCFSYSLYRLSETGELKDIACSRVYYHEIGTDDEELKIWFDRMRYYLENCYLLEGTEHEFVNKEDIISDIDYFTYENLK